jgi:hypothetical protein
MDDIGLFANATVDAGVVITFHVSTVPDSEYVSILFGRERITLDFFDVESLERLRDIADAGARAMQETIETNARTDATADNALAGSMGGEG